MAALETRALHFGDIYHPRLKTCITMTEENVIISYHDFLVMKVAEWPTVDDNEEYSSVCGDTE